MGWLELLPLLKRLLPLLTRVVPLLEGFVATRGLVREDLQTSLNDFKAQVARDLAASGASNRELADALIASNEQLAVVSSGLAKLHAMAEEQAERLSAVEAQAAAMAGMVRMALVLLGMLLVLSIVLLYLLMTRHA